MEPCLTCPPFSEPLINEQVQKIFSDPAFSVSDILKRFLQYIVRETLAGRSNMIKEYTIGVNVLNKPADFKPQHDAIVRIHAGRLRRALNYYYKEAGTRDLIEISMPKGSYVPVFGIKDAKFASLDIGQPQLEPIAFPSTTCIAIMPFRCFENDAARLGFADSLGQQLTAEFGRFADFSVIGYYATRQVSRRIADIRELSSLYGAQYAITGNVQFEGKRLRIGVQLTNLLNGEQVWAERYDHHYEAASSFEIQDEIVRSVIAVLADFYGLIVQQAAKRFTREKYKGLSASKALIWYHCFYSELNASVYMKALLAMDMAVKENPEYEIAWAYLGEFYLHGYMFNHTMKEDPILQGLHCVHKALRIDPDCQQAYITLGWANIYLKNKNACIDALEHALSINRSAAGVMGCAGAIMICAGEYERGIELLNKSIHLNRAYPPAFNLCMSLFHLKSGDYERAVYWSDKLDNPAFIWCSIIRVAAHALFYAAKDHSEMQETLDIDPRELNGITKEFIGKCLLDGQLVDRLYEGLQLAKRPMLIVA